MRLAKTTVLLSFFIDFMTKRQINGLQTCYVTLFLKNQANSYMFHSYEWTNENMNLLLKTEGKKPMNEKGNSQVIDKTAW